MGWTCIQRQVVENKKAKIFYLKSEMVPFFKCNSNVLILLSKAKLERFLHAVKYQRQQHHNTSKSQDQEENARHPRRRVRQIQAPRLSSFISYRRHHPVSLSTGYLPLVQPDARLASPQLTSLVLVRLAGVSLHPDHHSRAHSNLPSMATQKQTHRGPVRD